LEVQTAFGVVVSPFRLTVLSREEGGWGWSEGGAIQCAVSGTECAGQSSSDAVLRKSANILPPALSWCWQSHGGGRRSIHGAAPFPRTHPRTISAKKQKFRNRSKLITGHLPSCGAAHSTGHRAAPQGVRPRVPAQRASPPPLPLLLLLRTRAARLPLLSTPQHASAPTPTHARLCRGHGPAFRGGPRGASAPPPPRGRGFASKKMVRVGDTLYAKIGNGWCSSARPAGWRRLCRPASLAPASLPGAATAAGALSRPAPRTPWRSSPHPLCHASAPRVDARLTSAALFRQGL
jgi:hypothetical protein